MRKYIKNNLCNIIEQLAKVNETLIAKGMSISQGQVQEILTDCQQGAVEVGGKIEECEGEGTEAVRLLEQYCEKVYLLCLNWKNTNIRDKELKSIRMLLNKIKNSILYDIKDSKKEVVFLPYKASMWDSLESVWKAADEDPDCDAYVIAIPYYDKNPDGSFKEMHYEGDLYPKYVPITDWQAYDLEKRHPDVIFIHNPYDGGNHVTSVHPYYYSDNLKKYTNKLVYIPYFTTPDILPEEFCITSGGINADVIIVQSEKIRKNYLEKFASTLGYEQSQKIAKIYEKKIVALGSPKIEKGVKCIKEDYPLPKEWRAYFDGQDEKRKIVLYNTSISTLLKYDELYLKKLNIFLKQVKERKDILLWWRPHPLSEATICSMRPELYRKYHLIVERYKEEKWGIYDETPDLYRSIAWCDIYYGDRSSVTMLFSATKKPVIIQEIKECPLAFENLCEDEDFFWTTSLWDNGLFRIDKKSYRTEMVSLFEVEQKRGRLYIDIIKYDNQLVFVPFSADSVAIYLIEEERMIMLPLEKPREEAVCFLNDRKFTYASKWGKYIYMFPTTYPAILRLNMDDYTIHYLYEPIHKLNNYFMYSNRFIFKKGGTDNHLVKLWSDAANAIVVFDMKNESLEVCLQLDTQDRYMEMLCSPEGYWLVPREHDGKLLKVSKKYEITDCIVLPQSSSDEEIPYSCGICNDDAIILFPGTADCILKVSLTDGKVKKICLNDYEEACFATRNINEWNFFFAYQVGDCIISYRNLLHELIIYHYKNEEAERKKIWFEINNQECFMKKLNSQFETANNETEIYIYEGQFASFSNFIDMLKCNFENVCRKIENIMKVIYEREGVPNADDIGEKIYQYVTEES